MSASRTDWYLAHDGTEFTNSHWDWDKNRWGKPLIAVDFHHTITDRCPACLTGDRYDATANGLPQKGVARALRLLHKHFNILVFTGSGNFWDDEQCLVIAEYLKEHEIPFDTIRFDKPAAAYIIDDRGLHHRSWQETIADIWRRTKQW